MPVPLNKSISLRSEIVIFMILSKYINGYEGFIVIFSKIEDYISTENLLIDEIE
jgi:hypothetical protein